MWPSYFKEFKNGKILVNMKHKSKKKLQEFLSPGRNQKGYNERV